MRRKFLGVSQQTLAAHLGITFQQVQKYESGANRISASKLWETAMVLKAPVHYFFDGLGRPAEGSEDVEVSAGERSVNAFLASGEGVELAASFARIGSARHRKKLLALVREMADFDDDTGTDPSKAS